MNDLKIIISEHSLSDGKGEIGGDQNGNVYDCQEIFAEREIQADDSANDAAPLGLLEQRLHPWRNTPDCQSLFHNFLTFVKHNVKHKLFLKPVVEYWSRI